MPDINLILILESFLEWRSHEENNAHAQYYAFFAIFKVLINHKLWEINCKS
jgi:hypothetical protein